jgi:probable blue pigment (indigoidine) exporter
MKNIIAGLIFAALWGSGSVATKLGIKDGQPLLLINLRFALAALLMLSFSIFIQKNRLPKGKEYLQLLICGGLNMVIYPIAFVFAMKYATAGIGTLASAASPLLISILNSVWRSQKITGNVWKGLILGLLGVGVAIFPLLQNAHATPFGIGLLAFSILCYAISTVYYQSISWSLPRISINGWQVFTGTFILLPLTYFFYDSTQNHYTPLFWYSVLWLAIPISIGAVQIWLYLLKAEPVKAPLWLYLCPIFGFVISNILTGEPISIYTIIGTFFVIGGLYLAKK